MQSERVKARRDTAGLTRSNKGHRTVKVIFARARTPFLTERPAAEGENRWVQKTACRVKCISRAHYDTAGLARTPHAHSSRPVPPRSLRLPRAVLRHGAVPRSKGALHESVLGGGRLPGLHVVRVPARTVGSF